MGRLLLVGLAALLLASACGDEQPRVFADGIEPVGDCPDSRRRDDGTCRPESTAPELATVPGGFGVATFQLDPDNPLDPEASELHVLATERECASGQPPTGREVQPMVAEMEDAVEITILVETMRDADCPSNPSFPLTIELARPLGDRIIRDAALRPPVERPRPMSSSQIPTSPMNG